MVPMQQNHMSRENKGCTDCKHHPMSLLHQYGRAWLKNTRMLLPLLSFRWQQCELEEQSSANVFYRGHCHSSIWHLRMHETFGMYQEYRYSCTHISRHIMIHLQDTQSLPWWYSGCSALLLTQKVLVRSRPLWSLFSGGEMLKAHVQCDFSAH